MKPENSHSGMMSEIILAREDRFALGRLEIRPATREVVGPDGAEVLEPRVMQVLVALARAEGKVVARDDLVAACWGGRAIGDDAINRVIGRIRRLAERDATASFTLETMRKVGYRLTALERRPAGPRAPAPRRAWRFGAWLNWFGAAAAAAFMIVAAPAAESPVKTAEAEGLSYPAGAIDMWPS